MKAIETDIKGAYILEPDIHADGRGYFAETWTERRFNELVGADIHFVQDNESRSRRGVLRGLHFQRPPHAQAKLVRCTLGHVVDVALDLRVGSPSYLRHIMVELTADNHRQLFLPRGLAHGFAVISDEAVFQYKCDNYYAPEADSGINLFDPALGIVWPFTRDEAILSDKDLARKMLADYPSPFVYPG